MTSSKFNVPLLDDDISDDNEFKTNTGSLFKTHRQQIKTNIILSKSPKKAPIKESNDIVLQSNSTGIKQSGMTPPVYTLSSTLTNNVLTTSAASSFITKTKSQGNEGGVTSKPTANKLSMQCKSEAENKSVPPGNSNVKTTSGTLFATGNKGCDIKLSPIRPGGSSKTSLIVSARQRGNPIIKFIRNVPWEYGDIVPDYEMGKAMCALYLSLRYHHLNPAYVHERLKQLGRSYDLRVLLVQVDVKDPHHSLTELAKISILSDVTMIVAFSPDEAGRYLETYKAYESKPPDLIMEKTEGDFLSQFTDCITCNRKVNKTDAMTLLNTFGSFEKVVLADEEDLSLCPGFGPQKAKRLYEVLHEPFLKANKKTKTVVTKSKGKVSKEKKKEESQSHYFSSATSKEPKPSTSGTS